jgi:hypothetical protein
MKATFKNLGALKNATLDIGELTILTGKNNTGKTYATYAIYGFLRSWREQHVRLSRLTDLAAKLFNEKELEIDLSEMIDVATTYLRLASTKSFSGSLRRLFASEEKDKIFEDSNFEFELPDFSPSFSKPFSFVSGVLVGTREAQSSVLRIATPEIKWPGIGSSVVSTTLASMIAEDCLGQYLPRPIILTSERTGISLFWRELDTQKNVLVDQLKNMGSNEKINVHQLVREMSARYARPIQDNIDTTRNFPLIYKEESFLVKENPDVLAAFASLAGGSYKVGVGKETHFAPNTNIKRKGSIPLYLGSSSVRSLMSLGSYLQHQAVRGDLLMIDEPELNLHPEGQRQLARVLALLVNAGVKVFVTTHSDYLVREVNTLIKLSSELPHKAKLLKRLRYYEGECLKPKQVKLYVAESGTLTDVNVTNDGFSRSTFDDVLAAMNKVEDELMLAKEGLFDA